MINNPAISAVLATGRALIYDLVTLTINRGRCWQFDANGLNPVRKDILDSVRWTNAPRSLRANVADGLQVFQPLQGAAYQRGSLSSKAGAEVLQVAFSVAGNLAIYLSTAQDGSGSFATSLAELALLGLLDGATLTIDQVVCTDLPSTPVEAGPAYGIVSPDPLRRFAGIIRRPKPSGYAVEFDACDPLILGGGSVPRNLYSPLCPWEFVSGQVNGVGCPMRKGLYPQVQSQPCTHEEVAGASVVFSGSTVTLPIHDIPWGMLVPQDGPMMGMQFQIGNQLTDALHKFDFADQLPWTWSCTKVHVEHACSKAWTRESNAEHTSAFGCREWDSWMSLYGTPAGTITNAFGGHPDMPQPESA